MDFGYNSGYSGLRVRYYADTAVVLVEDINELFTEATRCANNDEDLEWEWGEVLIIAY